MCGKSKALLTGEQVKVFLGYYGGRIKIGDFDYDRRDLASDSPNQSPDRDALIRHLRKYKKEELAILIADLIDNGEEA